MSGVQEITVASEEADQRLDRWLRRRYPRVPQGRIERLCRKGEIRVDGGRAKPATRLAPGQTVRLPPIPPPIPADAPPPAPGPRISEADAAMIQACVIWRDDDIIALNKPPGLAVQGGSGQTHRHVDALADLALHNFVEMRDHTGSRAFLLRKTAERWLARLFPRHYIPLYTMISFTRIPYADARRRARRQDRVAGTAAAGVSRQTRPA